MKAISPLFFAALAFGIGAFAAGSVLAGAWTQKKGEGQTIAAATLTRSTRQFDDSGDAVAIPRYDKLEANLLVEYGVTDWLTTMLQPQLLGVDIAAPTDADTFGPGYTDLGARARLWSDERSVFSAQVFGRIPGRFDDDNPAEIGKTAAELDLRALYGRSFTLEGWSAFINAELAYRVRFDDPPNEARADFTFGVRPDPKLLLLAQSFNTISDGSAEGVFEDGREHKIQLSAVWSLDEVWSLQLGGIATVAGENALRERGVMAAVWRKF
jgi:protein XagA